jgi:hexosaminidase
VVDPSMLPPLLIPRPASVQLTGEWTLDIGASPKVRPGASADASYSLTITRDGAGAAHIEIVAAPEGKRYALATLAQLRTQYGTRLPCCRIQDRPAHATRGVMLDISRDRVPTMEHLLGFVDLLAALKFNHLQLYTEHTFAYRGHEEVWRGWDPMTPAEYVELDTACRSRGIELAANQNCFGHLAFWLRHPHYAPLAETHGEWVFEYSGQRIPRSGPFSLCPGDPGSLALIEDLLGQLLPCFSARHVNIGCDETFDVGYGRSADEVRARGRTAVCVEFIRKVSDIARRHGKRPQFWADIALREPEAAAALGDALALVWDYEPDYRWDTACDRLREAGREVWVCPGTSSWRSITGRTAERRANLREAARRGVSSGVTGILVTEWGDTGHHQQWPVTMNALAQAADAAWTGGREGYDSRAVSLHIFGDRSLGAASWLDDLGDADAELRKQAGRRAADSAPQRLRNSSALFVDLHAPLASTSPADADLLRGLDTPSRSLWMDARDRLQELESDPRRACTGLIADEVEHTLAVASLAADKALVRRGMPPLRSKLGARAAAIRKDHARLWRQRSREGGLSASDQHYAKIEADLRSAGQ